LPEVIKSKAFSMKMRGKWRKIRQVSQAFKPAGARRAGD